MLQAAQLESKPSMIVVTTPNGAIGRRVVRHLLDADEAVRVVVHDLGRLKPEVRDQVEIVEGSHGDAVVVDWAFAGAEALFWIGPPDPRQTLEASYLDFTRPAIAEIRRHRVGHVVAVSALGRGTQWKDRTGLITASLLMVDLLNATGAAVRSLALPAFMENTLQQVDAILQGRMFDALDPDLTLPHVAARDIAAILERLLRDRSWTGQEDVPVLGPDDLSFADIATTISDVLDREVRYVQLPFDAFGAQLVAGGMSDAFAKGFVAMMRARNEGIDNAVPRAAPEVGTTTFRQWAEAELKPAVLA